MTRPRHTGSLRVCVTLGGDRKISIVWFDVESNEVVWTEGANLPPDKSFVSQIACEGDFEVAPGYFLDSQGKRHFVLAANPGKIGALTNG